MSLLAIFARPDHPAGWGQAAVCAADARAHGYSVLAVRCADQAQLDQITSTLAAGFTGVAGQESSVGTWFGGRFDRLMVFAAGTFELADEDSVMRCFGDQRFAGIYDAEQILPAPTRRFAHDQAAFTRL